MCLDFTFKVGVFLLSYFRTLCACCISQWKFYVWSWREVPFDNGLHREKNPLLFFFFLFLISLDRISDAKINHQVNISSNTTFARMSRKYSFDAKLCMRLQWSDVARGGWLTGWRQLRVFKTLLAPPAYLTACSHEEATWTHTSTAAAALPAVSASRVWDWFCVTRFPLCSPTQPLTVACSIQI